MAAQSVPHFATYQRPVVPTPPFRQDADYLASQFGALQARRQYQQDAQGPVSAELQFESKQQKEITEAINAIQRAQQEANEAAVNGRSDDLQKAQEEMVKARGRLDRIAYEARLRNTATSAVVAPALQHYQGVTRGFDVDPTYVRPRTMYTDARYVPPPPASYPQWKAAGILPPTNTTSFSGKVMGKFLKQRLPNNVYTPTAYPLPPGVKYKASTTTPTP
jgi:hypothetical protein